MASFNAKRLAAALLDRPSAQGRADFADLAAASYLVRPHPNAGADIVSLWPSVLADFQSDLTPAQNRELALAILAEASARGSSLVSTRAAA